MEGHPTSDCGCTEENALFHNQPPELSAFGHQGTLYAKIRQRWPWLTWKEVKMQCMLAGPLIMGNLLSFSLQMVSLSFVGHFGELELSGASIASSFSIVTGLSIVIGMGSALETLCGQAYGAKQYQKMGIYMQRAMVVLNVTAIPLAFLWANMESLLLALHQDAQIAHKAGEYSVWLIPALFGFATSQPMIKFFQTQSIVAPMWLISLTVLLCHVPICWLLVYKSNMGFRGAALASSMSYWIEVLLLALYVRFSKSCALTRAPLSLEALQDLKGFLKLAIPSAAMICLEWWSFEILVILSGLLKNPELQTATISVCTNTETLISMLPLGLSSAASTRVSNELGAGYPQTARAAVRVAVFLAVLETLVVAVILLSIRNVWGNVFSSEKEVIVAVASLVPLLAMSTIIDGLQAVFSGVARGAGWQRVGAIINLGSFYVAGLPTACLLAFVGHLEGKGLWTGLLVGASVQLIAFVTITHFTDWQKEAEKAAMRMNATSAVKEPLLRSEE